MDAGGVERNKKEKNALFVTRGSNVTLDGGEER